MVRFAMLAALAIASTGCNDGTGAAQEAVSRDMKDPESATFRDVRQGVPGFVCGEVNGKNSYGAYSGFSRFVVDTAGVARIEQDSVRFTDAEWTASCDRMRIPTREARVRFLDSVRVADSVALAAREDSIGVEMLLKAENSLTAMRLRLYAVKYLSGKASEDAHLFAILLDEAVKEGRPTVLADTANGVYYASFCREMPKTFERYKWLRSVKEAERSGLRPPAACDSTP